jgi:hypothetical protein
MSVAISDNNKPKRGRPAVNSLFVGVRLPPDQLAAVDAWAAGQDDKPSRPEAIRRLIAIAVADRRQKPR